MPHWLFKSEPTTFSIDDLISRPNQTEPWNGVRNYKVRNMLRDEIKKGDLAFFYHSSCTPPGIVGIMKVVSNGYPDPTAFDKKSEYFDKTSSPENPRWYLVDVKFIKKFPRIIALDEIKNHPVLKKMIIAQKGNRLSITKVSDEEWQAVNKL
jgi:predicted RNA-binding protein with PUA-like domain